MREHFRRFCLSHVKKAIAVILLFMGSYIGFENAVYAAVCFLPEASEGMCSISPDTSNRLSEVDQCAAYPHPFKNSHCYNCTRCPSNNYKYLCTQKPNIDSGYFVNSSGDCIYETCPSSVYSYNKKTDEDCYDYFECINESSQNYGKYYRLEKVNHEGFKIVNGECQTDPGEPIDPCLEADYPYTQADCEQIGITHGENWQGCYSCQKCADETSARPNSYKFVEKETYESGYLKVGNLCKEDLCPSSTYTYSQEACVTLGSAHGENWQNCYSCQKCADETSERQDFYKFVKKETYESGYVLSENYLCIADPCSSDQYRYSSDQLTENYGADWTHCYTASLCEQTVSNQSGKYKIEAKESADTGYLFDGQKCIADPCSTDKYPYEDEASCEADIQSSAGTYWNKCYSCQKCTDSRSSRPNAYKAETDLAFEEGYDWQINSDNQCVPCGGTPCSDDRVGVQEQCVLDGIVYYKKCDTKETCFREHKKTKNGTCYYSSYMQNENALWDEGYYKSYECKTTYLQTIIYYSPLNVAKDCEGDSGPLYQKVPCKTNGSGNCVSKKYDGYYWCTTCEDDDKPTCYQDKMNTKAYFDPYNTTNYTAYATDNSGGECHISELSSLSASNGFDNDINPESCTDNGHTLYLHVKCQTSTNKDCHGKDTKVKNTYKTCTYAPADSECAATEINCGNQKYYAGHCNCGTEDGCSDDCDFSQDIPYSGYEACVLKYGNDTELAGYIFEKEKCKKCNPEQIISYYTDCQAAGKGCDGEDTPYEQGYIRTAKYCTDNNYYVNEKDYKECGNVRYYKDCLSECSYQQTASDCSAGQTFDAQCRGSTGIVYGECKDSE